MTTRAPKTRTAPVPAPAEDDVLHLTTTATAPVEEARRLLFTIDDDEFTVPKVIDQRIAFLGMDKVRRDGAIFGAMYITELVLGSAQYATLLDHYEAQRITQEQFDQAVTLINGLFFDHFKDSTDNPDQAGKASAASPNS